MMTSAPRRAVFSPRLAIVLAFGLVGFATSDASAQIGRRLDEHARRFYGPDYSGRGYADSLGLRGHKRCENGGYYGPPQIFSRQYGTMNGYRTVPPFAPLPASTGAYIHSR
jgi:hypothetical protein